MVLGFAVYGGANTVDLLRDRADLGIGVLTREVEGLLESAGNQAGFVARALEAGETDPDDPEQVTALLFGSMAADPAIASRPHPPRRARAAGREDGNAREDPDAGLLGGQAATAALRYGRANKEPVWAPPIYRADFDSSILTLQIPIYINDRFEGVLGRGAGRQGALRIPGATRRRERTEHIRAYGKERVLAHRLMAPGYPGLSFNAPLPALAGFGDAVLADMWRPGPCARRDKGPAPLMSHLVEVDGNTYLFHLPPARRLHGDPAFRRRLFDTT